MMVRGGPGVAARAALCGIAAIRKAGLLMARRLHTPGTCCRRLDETNTPTGRSRRPDFRARGGAGGGDAAAGARVARRRGSAATELGH